MLILQALVGNYTGLSQIERGRSWFFHSFIVHIAFANQKPVVFDHSYASFTVLLVFGHMFNNYTFQEVFVSSSMYSNYV